MQCINLPSIETSIKKEMHLKMKCIPASIYQQE